MSYNKSVVGQVGLVKIAGHWPRSLFAFLWPSNRRENLANVRAVLTELAWSIMSKYIHIYARVKKQTKSWKSPDEWATSKKACRDELVVCFFSLHNVYSALLLCIENCFREIEFCTLIYIAFWLTGSLQASEMIHLSGLISELLENVYLH